MFSFEDHFMDVDATAATSPSNNTMLLTSDQQLQQQQQQQPLSTADVTGITVGYALDTMRGHSWALLSHVSEHLAKPGVMALLAQRVLQISKGETAAGTKEELEEDEGQVAPLPASPTLIQSSLWLAMFGVNKRSLSDPLFKAAMADFIASTPDSSNDTLVDFCKCLGAAVVEANSGEVGTLPALDLRLLDKVSPEFKQALYSLSQELSKHEFKFIPFDIPFLHADVVKTIMPVLASSSSYLPVDTSSTSADSTTSIYSPSPDLYSSIRINLKSSMKILSVEERLKKYVKPRLPPPPSRSGSGSSLNRPPSAGSAKPVNAFVRKASTSLSIGRGKSSTLGSLSVPNRRMSNMPTSSSSLTSPLSAGTGLNSITSSGKGFIKEKRIMIMSEDQLKDITSLEQEALRKLEEEKELKRQEKQRLEEEKERRREEKARLEEERRLNRQRAMEEKKKRAAGGRRRSDISPPESPHGSPSLMYGGLPHDAQPPPHKRNRVSEDYSSGGAGGSGGGRLFDSSGGAGPMMVNQHSPMRKSPTNISPQQQSLPPPAPNPHPPAAAATVPNPLNTIWNEINELSDVDRIKIEQFISGQYAQRDEVVKLKLNQKMYSDPATGNRVLETLWIQLDYDKCEWKKIRSKSKITS